MTLPPEQGRGKAENAGAGIGFDTEDFGAALYASFWRRNNARDLEPWATQAEAIRKMWRCIALDAARYLLGPGSAARSSPPDQLGEREEKRGRSSSAPTEAAPDGAKETPRS